MVERFLNMYSLRGRRPGRTRNQVLRRRACTRKRPFLQPETGLEASATSAGPGLRAAPAADQSSSRPRDVASLERRKVLSPGPACRDPARRRCGRELRRRPRIAPTGRPPDRPAGLAPFVTSGWSPTLAERPCVRRRDNATGVAAAGTSVRSRVLAPGGRRVLGEVAEGSSPGPLDALDPVIRRGRRGPLRQFATRRPRSASGAIAEPRGRRHRPVARTSRRVAVGAP